MKNSASVTGTLAGRNSEDRRSVNQLSAYPMTNTMNNNNLQARSQFGSSLASNHGDNLFHPQVQQEQSNGADSQYMSACFRNEADQETEKSMGTNYHVRASPKARNPMK